MLAIITARNSIREWLIGEELPNVYPWIIMADRLELDFIEQNCRINVSPYIKNGELKTPTSAYAFDLYHELKRACKECGE